MYLVKAEANQIEKIVAMSVRAFETDVNVGGIKGDCPPEYDSIKWHQQMTREGHLYQAMSYEHMDADEATDAFLKGNGMTAPAGVGYCLAVRKG